MSGNVVSPPRHILADESESCEIIAGSLDTGIIFLCDHATNTIPPEYNNLGVEQRDLDRHIAYDIGAATVTRILAKSFGSPAVLSCFSRLLIDPNRGDDDPTLVMRISDGAFIKGNMHVDQKEINYRLERFYAPYHAAVKRVVELAMEAGIPPVIISMHSFTKVMNCTERPWHIGVLWDSDPRLTMDLLKALWAEPDLVVGDNQPYDGALAGDTIDIHATKRGLANTLIEIRNDLISTTTQAEQWGKRLARIIRPLLDNPELRQVKFHSSRTRVRLRPNKLIKVNHAG